MNWKVPNMWEGGEVWIIGGGPSVPIQFDIPVDIRRKVRDEVLPPSAFSPYMSPIHDKHIIGINMAFKLGLWIDMVYFGDSGFFLHNRGELAQFPNIKISSNSKVAAPQYTVDNIKYLQEHREHTYGISPDSKKVSWNQNSGAAAISIAANAGAKRIILLGFDMCLSKNDKQHWHQLYKVRNAKKKKEVPFNRHLKGFPQIAKDAEKRKIEIINACPNSMIEEFPKVSVKELLNAEESND